MCTKIQTLQINCNIGEQVRENDYFAYFSQLRAGCWKSACWKERFEEDVAGRHMIRLLLALEIVASLDIS